MAEMDKYTAASDSIKTGLEQWGKLSMQNDLLKNEKVKALLLDGQKKREQLQQDTDMFFKLAGNKDFPKAIRMGFYNNGVATGKTADPNFSFPGIDSWDDKVGDALDALGVIDDLDIDPKEKMRLRNIVIAQQRKVSGSDDQTKLLQDVVNQITPTEKKLSGQELVTKQVGQLKSLYQKLQTGGGIVDTAKGSEENVKARIASSKPGQFIAGALGTENQSSRNQINQMRPILINAIREATNQGARGLDSEKELEFYLQAATNPTIDIQSNLSALEILDKAYGLGMGTEQGQTQSTTPPANQPPKLTAEDQQALDWANANPNDPRAAKIKQRLGQ